MEAISAPMKSPIRPHLRRWNSIATSIVLASPKSAASGRNLRAATLSSSDDLELLPLKPASHAYSSLKDLLPSIGTVNSPQLKTTPLGSDICIRNRLVKQAARAYLTPMSAFPTTADDNFFRRLWTGVAALIDLFCSAAVRILDGAIRAVRIRSPGFKMCLV